MNQQSGMALTEMLVYLAISMVLMMVALPKALDAARRQATRTEMGYVASMLAVYEAEHDTLPTSLNALHPQYFTNGGYKQDGWGVPYSYDRIARTLCTTSFSYCMSL